MKSVFSKLIIAGLFPLFISPAFSADQSRGIKIGKIKDLSHQSGKLGGYKALIIGINDYKDPKIPDLETAVSDAKGIAKVLKEKYGFQVNVLLNHKATREVIYKELRSLAVSTKATDSVLIYYAGHGDLDRTYDDGWWIPADATGGNPVTYLDNGQVQKAMRSMKARHVLLISDSCYSGTLFGKARSLPPVIDDKYYLSLYNEKSRWGMTSGNKTPVSDEGSEGHSVFAYQLIKELEKNEKPFISTQEIYTRIAPIIGNNSEQTPRCSPVRGTGDQGGAFVFVAALGKADRLTVQPAPAVSMPPQTGVDKEMMFWQSIQNSDNPAIFEAYIEKFPNGTFVPLARIKISELKQKKVVASIAPETLKSKLFVETDPENTRIRILNIGPKFHQGIELDAGRYHVEVSASGFETKKQWVKLEADKEKRLTVKLAEAIKAGSIHVSGSPYGANAYLDGKLAGKIPILIKDIEVGNHTLEVLADGYETEEKYFALAPDEEKRVRISLNAIETTGSINVSGSPEGAKVHLDGTYVGLMPVKLRDVAEGEHRVEVLADGYKSEKRYVTLSAKEDKTLDIRLKRVAVAQAVTSQGKKITNSLGMKFVFIKPGTFMMGSPSNEKERSNEEKQHQVTLTKGFYMQTTEVTQSQWQAVMGSNPSRFKGDDLPVEQVSWNDIQEFIGKLNRTDSGNRYRLPTEAEWEYAARAGSTTRFSFGDDESRLGEYAWYIGNSVSQTHRVAQKKQNSWGLYDMHGNVWEWVQDWKGDYPSGSVTDPKGLSNGSNRVLRGGSWYNRAGYCRSAHRFRFRPVYRFLNGGFRLVLLPGH